MQVKGLSIAVVRERPVATPASAADAPARALPAPRAREGKVSLGLARDIPFDYLSCVRNTPARLGRMPKDPWASFDKTSQTVTKAIFKRVGFQASRT